VKKLFIPLVALLLLFQVNAFCQSNGSLVKVNEQIHGTFEKLTVYAAENCTDLTFDGISIVDDVNFSFFNMSATKEQGFIAKFGSDTYKRGSMKRGDKSIEIEINKKDGDVYAPYATVVWNYDKQDGEYMYDGKFTVDVEGQEYKVDYKGEACPKGASFLALMLAGLTKDL
jgi:hypothetical protein